MAKQPTAGKQTGKKTTKASAPSTTLGEILKLLNVSLDADNGVLTGILTDQVPELSVLESLKRSLVKLSDQLEIVSNSDETTIDDVKSQLRKARGESEESEEPKETTEEPEEEQVKDQKEGLDEHEQEGEHEIIDTDAGEVKKEGPQDQDGDVVMVEGEAEGADREKEDRPEDGSHKLVEAKAERKLSIDQMENDPSVKNPKSEFVTSQTLPAAALALGLFEEDGGLHQNGEEYLKKKYGVASYPQTDLQDKLPGKIPDVDFSKTKPTNQVLFNTFQTFFENFYRQFTEDDIKFLKTKYNIPDSLTSDSSYDPNITPYLIPELGTLYSEVWNNEEGAQNYSSPVVPKTIESVEPKLSSKELTDEVLETENVSCGPLVTRLLSAMLRDDTDDIQEASDVEVSRTSVTALPDQSWRVRSIDTDYVTFDERLKRELKHIGIFTNLGESSNKNDDGEDQEPNWLKTQDDEVCMELRQLQTELKQVSKRNNKRKRILIPIIEQQLAWQEYSSILDDLEKQIDQAYTKRIRAPKNKKRKTGSAAVPPSLQTQLQQQAAQQAAANSAVKSLLEKRIRWIEKIGPLFDTGDGVDSLKKYPKESVFARENLDEDDEEDYEDAEDLMLQHDS